MPAAAVKVQNLTLFLRHNNLGKLLADLGHLGSEIDLGLFWTCWNFLVPTTATCIVTHCHGGPPHNELEKVHPAHFHDELRHLYCPTHVLAIAGARLSAEALPLPPNF